jgi:hypothetical protein
MLVHLVAYIEAQRTIANYQMFQGMILFLLAVFFHISAQSGLTSGLKTGFIIFGLFSLVGGFAYKRTEENLLKSQTKLYHLNSADFRQKEKERMAKVVKNFPFIQLIFVVIIIISLVLNLMIHRPFINGLLFSLVVFLIGNLIIESISKKSIRAYYQVLSQK